MNTNEDLLPPTTHTGRDGQLHAALDAVGLGVWSWVPSTGNFTCSRRTRTLQGIAADLTLNFDAFVSHVHPEDRDALLAAMQDALHAGTGFSCSFRTLPTAQVPRRLHTVGRVIFTGGHASMLEIAGVVQEHTDGVDADPDAHRRQPSGLVKLDRELHVLSASEGFAVAVGCVAELLPVGRLLADLLPDMPVQWREAAASCLDGREIQAVAEPFECAAPVGAVVAGTFYPCFDVHNVVAGVMLALEVQSSLAREQEPAVAPLLSSQVRLLLDTSALAMAAVDPDGALLRANPAWLALHGMPTDPDSAASWLDRLHESDRPRAAIALGERRRHPTEALVARLVDVAGPPRWIESRLLPLRDDPGRLVGWLILSFDATSAMHEAGAAGQRVQQLRLYARHLQRRRELERIELAGLMRQDLQQNLERIQLQMQDLARHPDQHAAVRDALVQLTRHTQLLRDQLHELAGDLMPARIDDVGFAMALTRYVSEQRQLAGLPISLHLPESVDRLARRTLAAVYDVASEGIANAIEHARAGRIDVSVECRHGVLRLRVADDGLGLHDTDRSKPGRFGLFAASERIAQVDGTLRVFGVPGSGTVFEATVPIESAVRPGAGAQ